MAVPMLILKVAIHWLFSCYIYTIRKIRSYGFLHKAQSRSSHFMLTSTPNIKNCSFQNREDQTIIVSDFHTTLLRQMPSHSFPYFMLVAFEGGSLLRALLLLLSSPVLLAFGYRSKVSLKIMIFITFCGLKVRDMELVSRAVFPKFYLENLNCQCYEVFMSNTRGRRVVFSGLPRVMVEGFVKDYLGVDEVFGLELSVIKGCYFSGLTKDDSSYDLKMNALKQMFGETKADVGILSSYNPHDHIFFPYCKESYIVPKETDSIPKPTVARSKYPKPLIFHDSRLSFLPTPFPLLSLFLFLPISAPLSVARIAFGVLPPYSFAFLLAAATGVRFRATNSNPPQSLQTTRSKSALYVCTHRTLLDPVMLATALQRPIPAVTYSLSPLSEAIAPMRTVRLTRDRSKDAESIAALLKDGDLTICPEGTTCREPYLLRFSPLFAELAEELVPVALDCDGGWLYGTTASGLKVLDPFVFFMNPWPRYSVMILERVEKEMTCAGGWSGSDVANRVQRMLGAALGFECTGLTRRDKYMKLAGNEGVVRSRGPDDGEKVEFKITNDAGFVCKLL